jgi:hypothetical protein
MNESVNLVYEVQSILKEEITLKPYICYEFRMEFITQEGLTRHGVKQTNSMIN